MSAAAELKKNIAECEKGIAIAAARLKGNEEKIKTREADRLAWRNKRDAAETKWERESRERGKAQEDWERRVNEKAEQKRGDQKKWNSCVATWDCDAGKHNDWCRNDHGEGWYHSGKDQDCGACGKHGCTQCHGICKKDDGLRRREAESEIGQKPANYNEPRFNQQDPGEVQLDNTPLTIGCCNNQANIIGSELKDTVINQSNNCLSNLKDDVKKAEAADKAAAEKAAAAKTTAQSAAAQPVAQAAAMTASGGSPSQAVTTADKTEENKKQFLIIAAIVAALSCLLVMGIASIMLMT